MIAAGINVKYATAAAVRSAAGSAVIDLPHTGQNAALADISVPQCGHITESSAAFA
jgi:hypothetical protein